MSIQVGFNLCHIHSIMLRKSMVQHGFADYLNPTEEEKQAFVKKKQEDPDYFDPAAIYPESALLLSSKVGEGIQAAVEQWPHMIEYIDRGIHCPICLMFWIQRDHDRTCKEPDCDLKGMHCRFDEWVDASVVEVARRIKACQEKK